MGRLVGKRAVETSIDIASGSIPIYNKEYRTWDTINLSEVSSSDFPFTGSAVISGSLTVEGTTNLIGSSGSTVMTMNADTMVFSGSFNTSGSNTFAGSQIISGTITFEGGGKIIPNDGGQIGSIDIKAGDPAGWAELQSYNSNQYIWVDDNGAYVGTNWNSGSHSWTFGTSGTFLVPGDITGAPNLATTGSNSFTGDQTITGGYALKANTINNVSSGQRLTIDPDNSNYLYIKLDGFDDGGERISIGNTFPSSAGIYYYTDGGYYWRMYQNLLRFPDDTWQATAFTKQAVLNEGFATTGSNIFSGSQTIGGNIFLSSSFPLVYNNDSTNNMLFGMFDGSSIYGPYYQLFGNQYANLSQRGGAEFVYDIRNNPDANFHISSFNGSSWLQKFLVNDSGSQITGSLGVTNGIYGTLFGTSSYANNALTSSNALTASYVANTPTSSFAATASYVSGSNVEGTVSSSYTASIADNAYTASYIQTAQTASYISGSNVKGTVSSSYTASIADNAFTASFVLNAVSASYATQALTASHALTASSADNLLVRNVLSGSDALFSGTITAQTLHVSTISSSVVYSTGSNRLGSTLNDIQQLTGSVGVTGSLTLNNIPVLTADQTGSFTVATASYALTSSNYILGGVNTYVPVWENGRLVTSSIRNSSNNELNLFSGVNNYGTVTLQAFTEPRIYLSSSNNDILNVYNSYGDVGINYQTNLITNNIIRYQAYGGLNKFTIQTSETDRISINNSGSIQFNAYTVNGLLKTTGSNGTITLATASVDYVIPITLGNYVLNSATASMSVLSSSYALTASYAANIPTSASYTLQALSASYAATASSADNFLVRNVLSGSDALFTGTITAQTLHVQTVSSSVVYSTGSNKLGSLQTDIQQLTGSVGVTGSLFVNNQEVITANQTASMSVLTSSFAFTASYVSGSNVKGTVSSSYTASIADSSYTASYVQNAQTASYVANALTASYVSGSYVKGTVSSSLTASIADNAYTASYVANALTASYVQNALTASYISGSNVKGTVSSSYTASIADNAYTASYVQNAITSSYVNTASYALDANLLDGKDSSAFASTGSNIFSGSQYIYSGFRMYTDAVENYSGNTLNLFGDVKFNGNDNSVANNLSITGSLVAPNITGSLLGTASYANSSLSASYAVNSTSASSALNANNATSASYAVTSSYAVNALSASFAPTASFALNASDILTYVKNSSGAQINKGTVVRISGATGDNPLISTASYNDDFNSANTLGITNETIADGGFGYVMTEGKLLGINTNGFTAGQLLFLGPTGSIIGTPPVAPLHAVRLGQVLRVQLNNGSMYVRIDNGYELGELHDVYDTTTTSSFGDLLVRSGSVWTNSKQLTGSYGLTGSLTATSFTGSIFGTASYASTAISASYASSATAAVTSSYPFFVTGSQYAVNSSIVTSLNGRNFAPDVEESVFLGVDAGVGSNYIFQNTAVGKEAGASNTNSAYTSLLGYQAGYSASNAEGLVAIGAYAGYGASQSRYNNIIGGFAGNSLVNVEYSTVIGSDSLNSAMSSYGLIAIGNSTGNYSKKNDNAIFIGDTAGTWAISSSYSTFIGLSAGYAVKNTTSSIFIGNNAGRGPGNAISSPYILGRNNIIIGTSITLPASSSDSINIGGIIFGTGSYYSDAFNPTYFSGSANGKIGINQPLPKYDLDVAGAGNFTNGLVVTGSVVATSFTGSLFGTSSWAQKAVTASYALYADAVGTIVSGAIVTTGSNIFIGNQTISGSVTITNNLVVYGSASFTYVTASQLNISSSFISVNVFEPLQRFGGLIVYDSGSSSATASLAWDSLKDRWVYQNATGSTYSGGMLIAGPRNTGSMGDEPSLTNGRIPKSVGGDHIDNSIMSEVSGSIGVSGSLSVTGSLYVNNVAFNGNSTGVITGGNQVLVSTATGSFTSAFYNYTLASGSNARAGQFIVVWNGTSINYTDVSTTDIGNTSNVILTASLSGNNVNVSSLIPTNNWVVKTTVNLL